MLVRPILVSAFLLLLASATFGCSCSDPSVRERFRSSEVVFSGEVVVLEDLDKLIDDTFYQKAIFKIEKQWKGKKQDKIETIVAWDNPGWCGDLNLKVGEKFLIYAPAKDGRYLVYTDCGPNRNLKSAPNEVKALDSFLFRLFARLYPYPNI